MSALSFKDIKGNNIPFDNRCELLLDTRKDVVTNEITAYLVYYNDYTYEVDKATYDALKNL